MNKLFPLLTLLTGIWALFSFSGCSDILQSLRQESAAIDKEDDPDRDSSVDQNPVKKPRNLSGLTANNVQSYEAGVKREYNRKLASANPDGENPSYNYKRVTRADFVDKDPNENSLWEGQGQENFLFSHNRKREVGDLISAAVEKDLRREIQYQLWMTMPPELRKSKRAPASVANTDEKKKDDGSAPDKKPAATAQADKKSPEEKAKDDAEEAAKTNMSAGTKEDDIMRMEIVENLGNGLVRAVGQKRVVYRGVSRVVEVTAVLNNKDLDESSRIKSTAFLDAQTQVLQ